MIFPIVVVGSMIVGGWLLHRRAMANAVSQSGIQPNEPIVTLSPSLLAEYSTVTKFDATGIEMATVGKPTFVRISRITKGVFVPAPPGLVPMPVQDKQTPIWESQKILLDIVQETGVAQPMMAPPVFIHGIFRYDGPDLPELKSGQLFKATGTH